MKDFFKGQIKKNFKLFSFFFSIVRYKMLGIILLSICVGLLDGLGLAMFIPLLESVDSNAESTAENLGKLRFLIDGLTSLGFTLNLSTVLLTMLFFFMLKGLARFCEGYYKLLVSQFFIRKLRVDGISLLSQMRFDAFMKANSGRVQNTLSVEINTVTSAFANYMVMLQMAMMLLVYVTLAFLANAQFALLISLGALFSNFAFKFLYKKTKELSRNITHIQHGYQNLLIQTVAHFKYLKATGLMNRFKEMTIKEIDAMVANGKKIGVYNVILMVVREPLIIIIVAVVILLQVNYLGAQLSALILSLLFFYRALNFILNLQTQWNKILGATGSLENTQAFHLELKQNQSILNGEPFSELKQNIRINGVDFYYGQTPILKNIHLAINRNQTVAFVGESGSGKTTLVNMIAGLLSPAKGQIFIDDQDLTKINHESFQKRIGYITQEAVIFSDTIYNNVSFWEPKTEENVKRYTKAVSQASIDDFISDLNAQEETLLGNNGINLSGGQKQRISIARELYKDIDILIMDEATSALDSETELAIQENIDALKGQYTIFIVAHRLATIKNVDLVVLMDKGKIVDTGTYQELLISSKKFQRMVSLQELVDV